MHYHRIAGQFYNRPLLLAPSAAETISAFLMSRINAGPGASAGEHDAGESVQFFRASQRPDGSVEAHSPRASRFYGEYPMAEDGTGRPLPFRRTPEGVAIITLVGEFVNRGAYVGASSGVISYEGFTYQIGRAAKDPKSRVILLDLESPGGEAVGAFEAAAAVREAAKAKTVIAVVNGMACSAAYAIASGASRIVTLPTGLCGSIGVVLVHADFSRYLETEGVKPTLIFAGAHKVDGNPYEPLPASVRQALQTNVEAFYGLFLECVAAGRGKRLNAAAAKATEARVFMGQAAVDAGLADALGTFEDVLTQLSTSAPSGRANQGVRMDTNENGKTGADVSGSFTQADLNAAAAKATAAANARFSAILADDKVKGRERAAFDLALKSPAMAAADVVAFVADNVKVGSRLDAAVPDPKVEADAGANKPASGLSAAVSGLIGPFKR